MKNVALFILLSTIISSIWFLHYITQLNGKKIQRDSHLLPHFNIFKFPNVKNSSNPIIVPDIVHFLRLNQSEVTFIEAACILSVIRNQMPNSLYIHTNLNLTGKYWQYLLDNEFFNERYKIKPVSIAHTIFGQNFSKDGILFHGSDISRLRILRQYGGIFLDNDSYLVKNMDDYRRMEMSIGWDPGNPNIGTQILVANPDARFLQLWVESYRDHYLPELWYYNAGDRPYQTILIHKPDLIYNASVSEFGVQTLSNMIYNSYEPNWRSYTAIHLLQRHRDYLDHKYYKKFPVINDINVCRLNNTLGEMLRLAYYGSNKCPDKVMKIIRKKIENQMMIRRQAMNKRKRRVQRLNVLKRTTAMRFKNVRKKVNIFNNKRVNPRKISPKTNKKLTRILKTNKKLNKDPKLNDSKNTANKHLEKNPKIKLNEKSGNTTITEIKSSKHDSKPISEKDSQNLITEVVGDEVNYQNINSENNPESIPKNENSKPDKQNKSEPELNNENSAQSDDEENSESKETSSDIASSDIQRPPTEPMKLKVNTTKKSKPKKI